MVEPPVPASRFTPQPYLAELEHLEDESRVCQNFRRDNRGAFLAWGDPALYDSTLRIIEGVAAFDTVAFQIEVIPGITGIQALAASHRLPWNTIGGPVHITAGRRLSEERWDADAEVPENIL